MCLQFQWAAVETFEKEREREGERGGERERERVCVCVWERETVHMFVWVCFNSVSSLISVQGLNTVWHLKAYSQTLSLIDFV
jgi:hypothetical protein